MSCVFPSGVIVSVPSGQVGTYTNVIEGAVSTSNQTITTIASYITTPGSSGHIWAWFSSVRTNNVSERNTFEVSSGFYNNTGSLSFGTSQLWSSEADLNFNCYVIFFAPNEIAFRVSGQTGWDVNWTFTAIIVEAE